MSLCLNLRPPAETMCPLFDRTAMTRVIKRMKDDDDDKDFLKSMGF